MNATTPKTRSIPFSPLMVAAIRRQENPKTQTRRVVKPQPGTVAEYAELSPSVENGAEGFGLYCFEADYREEGAMEFVKCPYGYPGDHLKVGEAWRTVVGYDHLKPSELPDSAPIWYEADGKPPTGLGCWVYGRYRNARFLPMRFRRLTLEVVSVRVERLQSITEADAKIEGVMRGIYHPYGINDCQLELNQYGSYRDGFRYIWHQINGPDSWEANPWVWVVEFRVIS